MVVAGAGIASLATAMLLADDGHEVTVLERDPQPPASKDHVSGPWQYERLDGVGHWMQLEAPDTITRLLVEFLNRNKSRRSR